MNTITFVFWVSCAVVFIAPLYFVGNTVYKDGVVGRFAFLILSLVGGSYLFELLADDMPDGPPQVRTVWLMAAIAIFLIWHLWKFARRVHKPKITGDRRHIPDRRYDPEETLPPGGTTA